MIKLLSSINYRGGIIEAGSVIGYLPADLSKKLIDSGSAKILTEDEAIQEKKNAEEKKLIQNEKPLEKMNKDELLALVALLAIENIPENATKAQIKMAIEEKRDEQKQED